MATQCLSIINQANEIVDSARRGMSAIPELLDFTGGDQQAANLLGEALQRSVKLQEVFEEIAIRRACACIATKDRMEAARPGGSSHRPAAM